MISSVSLFVHYLAISVNVKNCIINLVLMFIDDEVQNKYFAQNMDLRGRI